MSDFFTPHTYFMRSDKVYTNTVEGAAIQAAIAYIVEHAEGTTESQVINRIKNIVKTPPAQVDGNTLSTQSMQKIAPGTIRHTPYSTKYLARS